MGNISMRQSCATGSDTNPTSPFSGDASATRQLAPGVARLPRSPVRVVRGTVRGKRLEASWTEPVSALEIPLPYTCVDWRADFDERFEWLRHHGHARPRFARERETGDLVAVEKFDRRRQSLTEASKFGRLDCELSVRLTMASSSVSTTMRGCYVKDDAYLVVSEPCDGATLRKQLQETGPMCENMVAAVLHSVMEILRLCEEKRIVHGNVTPEAFRLRTKKTDPFKMDRLCFAPAGWLKTTNFEHSRYLLHGGRFGNRVDPWDLPTGCRYSKKCLSPIYMAPEVFEQNYAYEADAWSLGILGYELLSGRFPFWSSKQQCLRLPHDLVKKDILETDPDLESPPFKDASSTCLDFLYRLLDKNPYSRMQIHEAFAHPWMHRRIKQQSVPHLGDGYLINPNLA